MNSRAPTHTQSQTQADLVPLFQSQMGGLPSSDFSWQHPSTSPFAVHQSGISSLRGVPSYARNSLTYGAGSDPNFGLLDTGYKNFGQTQSAESMIAQKEDDQSRKMNLRDRGDLNQESSMPGVDETCYGRKRQRSDDGDDDYNDNGSDDLRKAKAVRKKSTATDPNEQGSKDKSNNLEAYRKRWGEPQGATERRLMFEFSGHRAYSWAARCGKLDLSLFRRMICEETIERVREVQRGAKGRQNDKTPVLVDVEKAKNRYKDAIDKEYPRPMLKYVTEADMWEAASELGIKKNHADNGYPCPDDED
jgi:hypothetical protein